MIVALTRAILFSIIQQRVSLCAIIPIRILPINSSISLRTVFSCRLWAHSFLVSSAPCFSAHSRSRTTSSLLPWVYSFQRIVLPIACQCSSCGSRSWCWACLPILYYSSLFALYLIVAISLVSSLVSCSCPTFPGFWQLHICWLSAAFRSLWCWDLSYYVVLPRLYANA